MREVLEKLQTRRSELLQRIQNRSGLEIDKSGDPMDRAVSIQNREAAALHVNTLNRDLRLVEAAIRRVQDGSYGVCLDCDEQISEKRLKAKPEAEFCLSCAEARDKQSVEEEQGDMY